MTPNALFWLSVGPALAAVLAALAADGFARERTMTTYAVAALLGAGGLVGVVGGWSFGAQTVHGVFTVGTGHSPAGGIVLLLTAAAVAGSSGTRFARAGQGTTLVALAALGSTLAILSGELLVTLLALEVAAVSSYALVALGRDSASRESALKYFVQGAIASGLFVMGIAALAGGSGGDLSYGAIVSLGRVTGGSLPVVAAVLLVVAALAFKASAAPLHTWAPDAYQHAPASAAAVLAGPAKLAAVGVVAMLSFRLIVGGEGLFARQSVAAGVMLLTGVLALLSVAVGTLSALGQTSYRRMLGYAGVAQAGYALMAISAASPSVALVHMSMYAAATVIVFLAAIVFSTHRPQWDGSIAGLGGLGRRHPVLVAAVLVALASLAGLPPFAGFWGKLLAFGAPVRTALATSQSGPSWAVWGYILLVLAGVVGSVVSVAYYGAVVRELFFGEEAVGERVEGDLTASDEPSAEDGRPATVVAVVLALLLLAVGIAPLVMGVTGAMGGLVLTG